MRYVDAIFLGKKGAMRLPSLLNLEIKYDPKKLTIFHVLFWKGCLDFNLKMYMYKNCLKIEKKS